jgi:hypothetical protein
MAYCKNHPQTGVFGRCVGCAEEFCRNCLVEMQGQQYCGSCKVMALNGKMPTAAIAAQESSNLPHPPAKEALILSIVGLVASVFCFVGVILGVVSVVRGTQAKRAIAADPRLGGGGMATAAIVLGIIATVLGALNVIATIVLKAARF